MEGVFCCMDWTGAAAFSAVSISTDMHLSVQSWLYTRAIPVLPDAKLAVRGRFATYTWHTRFRPRRKKVDGCGGAEFGRTPIIFSKIFYQTLSCIISYYVGPASPVAW